MVNFSVNKIISLELGSYHLAQLHVALLWCVFGNKLPFIVWIGGDYEAQGASLDITYGRGFN